MTIEVTHVNALHLKHLSYNKWTVSWHGWPSENGKRARRTVHADGYEKASIIAAEKFCEWLSAPPSGNRNHTKVESISCGSDRSDSYFVGVTIKHITEEEILT